MINEGTNNTNNEISESEYIELNKIIKVSFPIVKYISVINFNTEIFNKILIESNSGLRSIVHLINMGIETVNATLMIGGIIDIMNFFVYCMYNMTNYAKINNINVEDFVGYNELKKSKKIH